MQFKLVLAAPAHLAGCEVGDTGVLTEGAEVKVELTPVTPAASTPAADAADVASSPPPHLPDIPVDQLTDVEIMGCPGAFGRISKAKWRGKDVIVKESNLRPQSRGQLERELHIIAGMQPHEYLVDVLGVTWGFDRSDVRLVLEFCPFGSLSRHLATLPRVGTHPHMTL